MLRVLRRARVLTLFALLAMIGSVPSSISALLHDADDAFCQPTVIVHDETAHRIGAARTASSEPQHCAVCHWLQSLHSVIGFVSVAIPTSDVHGLILWSPPAVGRHSVGTLSARAPPL